MPFNGSGTFLRVMNWVNDATAGIRIRADRHDSEDDNLALGLSQCITKDGQTTITNNLPMATYRHTNVGVAVNRNEYARYDQVVDGKINWAVAGGTVDAITASYDIPIITLVDGQIFFFRASGANVSTTPTFSPDSNTPRTIVKNGAQALSPGDIPAAGYEAIVRYNLANTRYELLNPAPSITSSGNNTFTGNNTYTGNSYYPSDGELVIASGAITVTGTTHVIDTEGAAPTDDLVTINGGTDGQILILRTKDSARDVTLKSTGNIGITADIVLSVNSAKIILQYDGTLSKWLPLAATSLQGAKADTAIQPISNRIVKTVIVNYTANADLSVVIPLDNSIPQNTEGTQIINTTYTMENISNKVRVRLIGYAASPAYSIAALFKDNDVNAIAVGVTTHANNTYYMPLIIPETEIIPAASSVDIKVRVGANSGTMRMNGGISSGLFGGIMKTVLVIEEISP